MNKTAVELMVKAFTLAVTNIHATREEIWTALEHLLASFILLEIPEEHQSQMILNFADEVRQIVRKHHANDL